MAMIMGWIIDRCARIASMATDLYPVFGSALTRKVTVFCSALTRQVTDWMWIGRYGSTDVSSDHC